MPDFVLTYSHALPLDVWVGMPPEAQKRIEKECVRNLLDECKKGKLTIVGAPALQHEERGDPGGPLKFMYVIATADADSS